MNLKTITTLALLVTYMHNLAGQNGVFAPIGAQWYYRPEEFVPDTKLYRFTVSKDTLLHGELARELACAQWVNGAFQAFPDFNKYVYTQGDSVFYDVDNQWVLLFNFAAVAGDTLHTTVADYGIPNGCFIFPAGQPWEVRYRIDSTSVETIDGALLRVQYVHTVCEDPSVCWIFDRTGESGKIVERIGAIYAGYWWGQGASCLAISTGHLSCYHDSEVNYIAEPGNVFCQDVNTAEVAGLEVQIYPNPTDQAITFSYSPLAADVNYRIYNALGHTLETGVLPAGSTTFSTPLVRACSGILYVTFTSKQQSRTFKIVKM